MMTREMQLAFDTYKVQQQTSDAFPIGLQLMRLALVTVGTLTKEGLASMLKRGLITDDEIDIYVAKHLIDDFRLERAYQKHQQQHLEEREVLRKRLHDVLQEYHIISSRGRMQWYKIAKEHPELEEAKQIIALAEVELNEGNEL
jgi:hypothetical protein